MGMIEAGVFRNPIDSGANLRFAPEFALILPDPDKYFLKQIVGFHMVSGISQTDTVYFGGVGCIQFPELTVLLLFCRHAYF